MAMVAYSVLLHSPTHWVARRISFRRAFSSCRRLQDVWMSSSSICTHTVHAKPRCSIRDLPYDQPTTTATTSATQAQPPESKSSMGRLLLVDGSAVIFRAFYKLMSKYSHDSMVSEFHSEADWVLTVLTSFTTILGLLELNPSHLAVVFDHKGGDGLSLTFRHTLFPEYKKNRPPTPETILQGLEHLRPALVAMGLKVLEVPGVEADDVIATLTASGTASQMKVRIVSPDKDFFQILSPDVRLLRFVPKGAGMVSFGLEEFSERFGDLKPEQFVDVLSLVGDTCDNVPGVPGIGEKTAIQLISQYGSVENLLLQRENVTVKRAVKGLMADKGEALLSKRLVALRADLPSFMVPFTMEDLTWRKPHDSGEKLFQLLIALSAFVESEIHVELQERILKLWKKLETSDT